MGMYPNNLVTLRIRNCHNLHSKTLDLIYLFYKRYTYLVINRFVMNPF